MGPNWTQLGLTGAQLVPIWNAAWVVCTLVNTPNWRMADQWVTYGPRPLKSTQRHGAFCGLATCDMGFLKDSDMGHVNFFNSTGWHDHFLNSTGRHCSFLKSTCDTGTPRQGPLTWNSHYGFWSLFTCLINVDICRFTIPDTNFKDKSWKYQSDNNDKRQYFLS